MKTKTDERDRLKEINAELLAELKSAAMTAHYHNSRFCFGVFDRCENCKNYRDAISKAEKSGVR
jgi:hypothetical protein